MNEYPHRKTIRLRGYDYRSTGIYHVTICTRGRQCLFGIINDGNMVLNALGEVAQRNIPCIVDHFPEAVIIDSVVMPNHVHLLLGLGVDENAPNVTMDARHTLGQIINLYKGSVTKACGRSVWQSRFYDHIIRGERDLTATIEYIQGNPKTWEKDDLYYLSTPP